MADQKDLDVAALRRGILGKDLSAGDLVPGTDVNEMSVDPVTGLLPRALWEAQMKHHYEYAKRTEGRFAIAMLDLDDFKTINDTYGHQKGDEMLRKFGEAVQERFRTADIKGRFGGDEIIVMLTDFGVSDDELHEEEREISRFLAEQISNGVSVGIAKWNGFESLKEIIERADQQLYRNKHE